MTNDDIKATVLRALAAIAPEMANRPLPTNVPLREELDLDSFDFLTFVIGLHTALGVEIPEADYQRLGTLDEVIAYLVEKLPR